MVDSIHTYLLLYWCVKLHVYFHTSWIDITNKTVWRHHHSGTSVCSFIRWRQFLQPLLSDMLNASDMFMSAACIQPYFQVQNWPVAFSFLSVRFLYKMIHLSSSLSFNRPSSFSISFNSVWNTSATFSPVLLEHSKYGMPKLAAKLCACCRVTSRSSTKSFILPTNTRGTSGASPKALSSDSLILMIFSKDDREVVEKISA